MNTRLPAAAAIGRLLGMMALAMTSYRTSAQSPTTAAGLQETVPSGQAIIERVRTDRPRVLLDDQRLTQLKHQSESDARLRAYIARVLQSADAITRKAATQTTQPDKTDAKSTRVAHDDFITVGLAWRWTGEPARRDAMLALARAHLSKPDWGDGLNLAENLLTGSILYDWLHDQLTPAEKQQYLAHVDRALKIYSEYYRGAESTDPGQWQVNNNYNWNPILNGALVSTCIALGDETPAAGKLLLPRAIRNVRRYIDAYDPDGVGFEGPGYWMYGMMHFSYLITTLQTSLHTDFGLLENAPGIRNTGRWLVVANSPIDRDATFSDPGLNWWNGNRFPLLFLARQFDQPALAARMFWYTDNVKNDHEQMSVIFYPDRAPQPAAYPFPLDQFFRSTLTPMAFTRSSATERNALWAYLKAGKLNNHGHLDFGAFELGALGVHWAHDLGGDNYDLYHKAGYKTPAGFDAIYRRNNRSHNVVTIDDQLMSLDADVPITRFHSDETGMHAVVDLTTAYPMVKSARRGIASLQGRRALLVQDEFQLDAAHAIQWNMMTTAAIELQGDRAILKLDNQTLEARILSPAGATFSVASADRAPPEKTNKGFRQLRVQLGDVRGDARGEVRIAVLLSPVWPDATVTLAPDAIIPLDRWPTTSGSNP